MIHEVFNLLKDKLNTYFRTIGQDQDKVDFVKTEDGDETIKFQLNQVTPVLVNIEEDRIMRQPDLYGGRTGQGEFKSGSFPEIRINLLVLFVAKFGNYAEGLNFLSHVIKFFQVNRVFDQHNSPTLSPEIEKLIMELSPPVLQEQDAVWNALRTSYLPSVLYKVKMLVYLDEESLQAATQVLHTDLDIGQTNTPPLPDTSFSISSNSPVNQNTSAVVEITPGEAGITYQLYTVGGEASGEAVTANTDEETISLTSDQLTADVEFKIKATNLAAGVEAYSNDNVNITMNT